MTSTPPHSPSPSGRVALVTGAADRIGAAIARRLAREGWAVVITYRAAAEKAAAVIGDIEKAGGQAAALRCDLTDLDERNGLIAAAAKPFGPLSLLINNASVFVRDAATDLDQAIWDEHFALHVEAPAFLARDFSVQLLPETDGNIINIIDARVLDLTPAYFSYTLSKAALWTMTQTLAQSLAPRIRVNAIGPGPAVAPADVTADSFARQQAALPLGRAADADGIAEGVLTILALGTMTGQMLALDGGEHLDWPARRGPTPRRR